MAKELLPIESPSEKAERLFLPSVGESLMESVRLGLPDDKGPALLVAITTKHPGLYSYFIGKLVAGSSFKSAALSMAIPSRKLTDWLQQGAADLADDQDTYCSRLLLDVQRAAALAVGDAEERVHKLDPSKWLARGPAKDFHKGRYWKETFAGKTEEEEGEDFDNPIEPLPVRPGENEQEENDNMDKQLEEAIKQLEVNGILKDPEFISQAREQYRIQKDDTSETNN